MDNFGNTLSQCRKAAHLTQEDIGKKLGKTPATISRIENEDGAALPTSADINILLREFRGKKVQEALLGSLQKAWELESQSKGSKNSIENSTIALAITTMERLSEIDRLAFGKDLDVIIHLWRRYVEVDKNFSEFEHGYLETEKELGKLLNEINIEKPFNLESRSKMKRGIQRRYLANIEGAKRDYLEALEIVEKLGDYYLEIDLLILLGDLYRRSIIEELRQAIDYYKKAEKISGDLKIKNPTPKIKIASCYMIGGTPKSAAPFYEEGLNLARVIGDRDSERKALEYKAWANSMFGYLDEALKLQSQAHGMALEMNLHPKELAKSCNYLGGYYLDCGLLQEAEKYYEESERNIEVMLKKVTKDSEEKELFIHGCVLQGLGRIYMQNPSKQLLAEESLIESREIGNHLNEFITIGYAYELLGQKDTKENDFENARIKFTVARKYYEKSGLTTIGANDSCNPYKLAGLELSLTELELRTGDISEAQYHMTTAIDISKEHGFLGYLVLAQLLDARIEQIKTNPDINRSVDNYFSAIQNSLTTGHYLFNSILVTIDKHLKDIYKKNKRLALSLLNQMVLNWVKDQEILHLDEEQSQKWKSFLKTLATYQKEWQFIHDSAQKN